MKNIINGFKSIFKNPTKFKLIGFIVPVGTMIFLLINKPNIFITFFGFWGAIPIYIWVLGSVYKENNIPVAYKDDEINYKNPVNSVSHIERKTTVTNTTVTTETIYFKDIGGNYLE